MIQRISLFGITAAMALVLSAQAQPQTPPAPPSFEGQQLRPQPGGVLPPGEGAAGAPRMAPQDAIAHWKEVPRKSASDMMQKYGEPDEVTKQRVVWHNKGPWKRIEVINEEIPHHFPMPHKDTLKQTVNLTVPADKFDELAEYDGSVLVDRTRGEISARCDKEPANFLALNLAHDIISGKKNVQEAREFYAKTIQELMQGQKPAYTQSLQFQTARDAAGFTDQPSPILEGAGAPLEGQNGQQEFQQQQLQQQGQQPFQQQPQGLQGQP